MNWVNSAKNIVLIFALIVLVICLLFCFLRTIIGPKIADRIVGVNMIGTQIISMICILAILLGEGGLVDMAIIYSMLSFLSVVFFTRIYIGIYNEHHMEKEEKNND